MEIILYNGPSAIVGANVCECDIENEHTCSLEYRGVGMCTSLISQAGNRGGHGVCMYVCMYVVQYKLPTAGDKKKHQVLRNHYVTHASVTVGNKSTLYTRVSVHIHSSHCLTLDTERLAAEVQQASI